MKNKPLAILSPICLCLHAAAVQAAIEPFTLGASEAVKHESNVTHTSDDARVADWISTTEFTAALDQALGRDQLVADAAVNYSGYKRQRSLDAWGYRAGIQLNWNTIGDLSGAFGADTSRRRYLDDVTTGPLLNLVNGVPTLLSTTERNMQTDNHVFGRILLGGPSRWQIFAGADASQRRFSASDFRSNDERQWSGNFGTRYSTSPDLTFGLQANYLHGEFPHVDTFAFGGVQSTVVQKFDTRSIDGTVQLKATGNSTFDASVGYTKQHSDALARDIHFVNGSLNWTWAPPSHFTVKLGLKRSTDFDTSSTDLNNGIRYSNNLSGPSVNNLALADVTYALTAKISLDANASYSQRKYSDVVLDNVDVSGTLRTTTFYLSAHYQPTRTTDLSCGGGREQRRAGATFSSFAYTDNTVRCIASIKFD
ncbi:MAG TPA: hypothetical protein VES00_18775 [Burkholderiaceae bacterium]|jgi:hypothetical protein|nr:hypothetical protein [Burkholderiaceae bacterium]